MTLLRPARPVELLACLLLVASVMAGKFSLDRLLPGLAGTHWTEFRLWALAGAALAFAPWRLARSLAVQRLYQPPMMALGLLLGILLLRALHAFEPDAWPDIVDLLYLAAQAVLLALANRRQVLLMSLVVVVLAAVMFLMAAAGMGHPELNGEGWAPMGGPTTFYRIEFLAFCICWAWYADRGSAAWPLALASALFLFGALASLSKIAMPGAVLVMGVFAVHRLWLRDWRGLACLLLIAVGVRAAWSWTMSDAMERRMQRAATVNGSEQTIEPASPGVLQARRARGERLPTESAGWKTGGQQDSDLRIGTDFEIRLRYCVGAPEGGTAASTDARCLTRSFVDRSSRLLFAAEALRGMAAAPWFGNGHASFELHMPNPQTGRPEVYTYPHNLLLEVGYEAGVIGLAALLLALAAVARATVRAARLEPSGLYLAGYLAFILLSTLVSGDFYDSRLLWLTALAIFALSHREAPAAARA